MTFEAPIWLALTPLFACLSIALIALGWRKRGHLLERFAASRLLETLTEKASLQRKLLKSALIVAAVITVALALARPQYGVEWSERKARGLDIVFVLDSSKSMLATDLRPTRLERAKLAILDLMERLESDRIGLVAFAGQAFLQTPPTLDYGAFRESLNATDPSILSRGGSDLGRAIEEAAKAFPSENNVKVVVLLTDGEDLRGEALTAARTAAENGIQIFTIGLGTPEGEYLRVRNAQGIEEFVRDSSGQPVRSQLDESTLQQIAQITGGSYSRLGGNSLDALYDSVLATLPREERESEMQEVRIERFQWLLAAALVFLVLESLIRSRRTSRHLATLLLVSFFIASPNSSEADPYRDAHVALMEKDFARANELYTEAIKQSDNRSLQRDALYNMGHATYQLGRTAYDQGDPQAALKQIQSAERLFESALEIDPSDKAITHDLERTKAVREAIEKLIEEQQEQEKQDQEQSDEQDDSQSENSDSQDQQGASQQDQQEQQQDEPQQGEEQNTSDGQQQQQNQEGDSQESDGQDQQQQQESGQDQQGEGQQEQQDSQSQAGEEQTGEEQNSQNQAGENEEQSGEQQEGTVPEEENPEQNEESTAQVPEVAEAEEGDTEGEQSAAAQSGSPVQIEGMSLQEAQDLLDSLRGKEEILPFTKPVPGRGRPLQDW